MPVLEIEASLTDRYQSTVPAPVRRALRLRKRDKIIYQIVDEDTVIVRKKGVSREDPAVAAFLDFLARDLGRHPEHIQAVPASLRNRLQALVGDIEVDLDQPLQGEDDED
jgi:antitoxin PrlF